jgi:hypothetical protein
MRKTQLLSLIVFLIFPMRAFASAPCSSQTGTCPEQQTPAETISQPLNTAPSAETSSLAPMTAPDKAQILSHHDDQASQVNAHDSELFAQPQKATAIIDPGSLEDSQRLKIDPHQ